MKLIGVATCSGLRATQAAEIDAGSTTGCRSGCLACGLTLTCLESKPSSRVITANKNARILWAVMTREDGFDSKHVSVKPQAKKPDRQPVVDPASISAACVA